MNNLKIKDHENLEKDPNNGAILLNSTKNNTEIKLDNLWKKLSLVEKQNEQIIELLERIVSSNS